MGLLPLGFPALGVALDRVAAALDWAFPGSGVVLDRVVWLDLGTPEEARWEGGWGRDPPTCQAA
ncbi:hypothetical protein Acsp05_60080 [Actinokineospora sp. NBRC 105648]|nr:hypothetical protein Acsp05_60080 [Actinokineospora sp. NBRC 105648]